MHASSTLVSGLSGPADLIPAAVVAVVLLAAAVALVLAALRRPDSAPQGPDPLDDEESDLMAGYSSRL